MTEKSHVGSIVDPVEIVEILELLPHRYPMLLIDRVVDLVPGVSATGIKNVTINEPHFQGHFPVRPIMPGVLIVEAMAQTSAVVVIKGLENPDMSRLVYFMSIDSARFRRPVEPGDQMLLKVEQLQNRRKVWKFGAKAEVDGRLVADAVITAMIVGDSE